MSEDLQVDRWRAFALWQTGQWGDGRYADYLEGRPEHDDDPMETALIARLRGSAVGEA